MPKPELDIFRTQSLYIKIFDFKGRKFKTDLLNQTIEEK